MKTLASELAYFFKGRHKRNLKVLSLYIAFLVALVLVYAVVFKHLMWTLEGREYSLVTGIYWTITAMTTLGYGDITFHTEAGHVFSMFVTVSGVLFLLIILPFSAISLFIGPYMEQRLRFRPRLGVPESTRDHVIICGWDPITRTVARNLQAGGIPYFTVESDYQKVVLLDEEGVPVIYGLATDAEVLQRLKAADARGLIANLTDTDNANLALTVRSLCDTPVVAVVTEAERVELIKAAGASHAIALRDTLGSYLAIRATTHGAMSHVVDSFGELLFAEIPARGAPFVGVTLQQAAIREKTGASVIGIWERGRFTVPKAETRVTASMVLLLVGTKPSLEELERLVGETPDEDLVVVMGYGTVGRSAASYLARAEVPHVLVDKVFASPVNDAASVRKVVEGDAIRRETLETALGDGATGVIITTNDDGANVFLTLACCRLNPHMRIVARANREENVAEIYAAGADFVVSYASVGANILTNVVEKRKTVFLTEGVHIFWRDVPPALDGYNLATSHIRNLTGATVVGIQGTGEELDLAIGPQTILRKNTTLLMVGPPDSEASFVKRFRG